MYTPRPDPPQERRLLSKLQSTVLGVSTADNCLTSTASKGVAVAAKRASRHSKIVDKTKEQLIAEVEALRTKLVDRETKLASQTSKSAVITDLERKLEHLIDKHKASKAKAEAELSKAHKDSTELKSEIEILKHQVKEGDLAAADAVQTLARVTREATEARKQNQELVRKVQLQSTMPVPVDTALAEELAQKLEAAEETNERLRRERDDAIEQSRRKQQQLESLTLELEASTSSTAREEALHNDLQTSFATAAALREELKVCQQARSELEGTIPQLEDELVEAQEETAVVKSSLQAAALAYATLYRESVPITRLRQTTRDLAQSKIQAGDLQSSVVQLKQETAWVKEEMSDLHERLTEARIKAEDAEKVIAGLVADRAQERTQVQAGQDLAELESMMLEIALEEAEWNELRHRESRRSLHQAESELKAAQEHTQHLLTSLRIVNAELVTESSRRQADETQLAAAIVKRDEVLAEWKVVEKSVLEDRAKVEQAEVSIARWKVAEAALEEEIEGLRNALTRAARFEEAYVELEGSYRALLSCQAETEDEADRLGKLNSELRGLGGSDKISYVETVRRESAAVKQELAATRSLLNTARARIAALDEEIESYKAVGSYEAPKRVRVARRLPEDGRLGTSVLGKSFAK